MRTITAISVAALATLTLAGGTRVAHTVHHLRMRVAVAPLDWGDRDSISNVQIPADIKNAIDEKLVKKLKDTGDFVVLERGAIQSIEAEKNIKAESSGQNQKGKVTPAQSLIKAKVTDFNYSSSNTGATLSLGNVSLGASRAKATVGVNVRIFDVDSSEVIDTKTSTGTVTSNSVQVSASINSVFSAVQNFDSSPIGAATTRALDRAVNAIVKSLEKIPWTAIVADWDPQTKEITMTAGEESGVEVGDVFEVIRTGKIVKNPETGEVLGKKSTHIGRLRVISIDKRFATAVPTDGTDFQPGDIITEPADAQRASG